MTMAGNGTPFTHRDAATLREAFTSRVDNLEKMLQERYERQTTAVETAFAAQNAAMQAALTAADRAVSAALLAAEKAVSKAETDANKRFEGVNEFRGMLADQQATFVTRLEHDALAADIQQLRIVGAELRGKASQNSVVISYIIGFAGIAIAVAGLLLSFFTMM